MPCSSIKDWALSEDCKSFYSCSLILSPPISSLSPTSTTTIALFCHQLLVGKFKRLHFCSSDANFTLVLISRMTSKPFLTALHKFLAWFAPGLLFAALDLQQTLYFVYLTSERKRYSRFSNLWKRRLFWEGRCWAEPRKVPQLTQSHQRVGQSTFKPEYANPGKRGGLILLMVKIQNVESATVEMLQTSGPYFVLFLAVCLIVSYCKDFTGTKTHRVLPWGRRPSKVFL